MLLPPLSMWRNIWSCYPQLLNQHQTIIIESFQCCHLDLWSFQLLLLLVQLKVSLNSILLYFILDSIWWACIFFFSLFISILGFNHHVPSTSKNSNKRPATDQIEPIKPFESDHDSFQPLVSPVRSRYRSLMTRTDKGNFVCIKFYTFSSFFVQNNDELEFLFHFFTYDSSTVSIIAKGA